MRKILAILTVLISTNNVLAQTNMNIYYSNGTVLSTPISDIDTLYYVNGNTCPATVTDVDGNVYNTVLIGNQCWMKENLKTTQYKNSTLITTGLSNTDWTTTMNGACADYNNDTVISSVYGKLYNWYAVVDSSGLCPVGWHVPNNSDWNVLVKTIDQNADTNCIACIQSMTAGGALKEVGTAHWIGNNGATNSTGFTAIPAGSRTSTNGSYTNIGGYADIWTSTTYSVSSSYVRGLIGNNGLISRFDFPKREGLSVRCIKD
jgi:uncharacterized protein (TIGR02145 family)